MKKAIIFDMDGLMIDSERMTWKGYRKFCSEAGYTMELPFYKKMLGHPMKDIRKMMIEEFGEQFPLEEIISKVHADLERQFREEGVPKKPGLDEILEYGKESGYKMLVATSSDRNRVEKILKYAEIEVYFDDIICGDEVENGKPDPEVFINSCKKLHVSPAEAYVIEDSEMGVLAASRAGIDVICVPDMKEPEEKYRQLAFSVVKDLKEAKDLITAQEEKGKKQCMDFIFHHVCVIASDYDTAVDFYCNKLGMEIYRETYSQNRHAKKLELHKNGKYLIELFVKERKQRNSGAEPVIDHISFLTEDVETVQNALKEKGVPFSDIKVDKTTGKLYGFCEGPDGIKLEFYEA